MEYATVVLDRLAENLAGIAWRPLTPRHVVAVLGISGQERVRWTKDGRLPVSGQAVVKAGRVLAMPTYDLDFIKNLASRPAILSAWRAQDEAARRSS